MSQPWLPTDCKTLHHDEHEMRHKYFINQVLTVCTSTPDLAIYGEVARLPLAYFGLKLIINIWNYFCAVSDDRLRTKK